MKAEIRYVSIICIAIVVFNLCSVTLDKDLTSEFKWLSTTKFIKVSDIEVGDVFSNSFFFTSKKNLNLKKDTYYMMRHLNENEIIYFKVNTIKFKDTLYFFQNIDWLTKKTHKIKSGPYELQVSY